MHNDDIQIFDTPQALAAALADFFVDQAISSITERGGFYVALAGGTTPKAAYELLACEPRSLQVNWKDVYIYFGDERCVPPDDEQSNYRTAKTALLDLVPIPPHNIHRMRGEGEPAEAAAEYVRFLKEDLGELPQLDLIMLGMGPDGHTASLFPGTSPETDDAQLVRCPYVPKFETHRLTLTPRVINNARAVVVATEGTAKADALAAVLNGPRDPVTYPIQIVAPTHGHLTWLVDRAAAAKL